VKKDRPGTIKQKVKMLNSEKGKFRDGNTTLQYFKEMSKIIDFERE